MEFNRLCDIILEGFAVRSYSCLMLDCQFLYEQIKVLHSNIDERDIFNGPGHGLEHESHITVLYGIHEETPKVVYDSLSLYPAEFTLTGLSLFEDDEFDVLKFTVKSPDLHDLNDQAKNKLSCTSKFLKYEPHLTICYLLPGTGKKYLKSKCDIIGKKYFSDQFIFSNKNSEKVYWKV